MADGDGWDSPGKGTGTFDGNGGYQTQQTPFSLSDDTNFNSSVNAFEVGRNRRDSYSDSFPSNGGVFGGPVGSLGSVSYTGQGFNPMNHSLFSDTEVLRVGGVGGESFPESSMNPYSPTGAISKRTSSASQSNLDLDTNGIFESIAATHSNGGTNGTNGSDQSASYFQGSLNPTVLGDSSYCDLKLRRDANTWKDCEQYSSPFSCSGGNSLMLRDTGGVQDLTLSPSLSQTLNGPSTDSLTRHFSSLTVNNLSPSLSTMPARVAIGSRAPNPSPNFSPVPISTLSSTSGYAGGNNYIPSPIGYNGAKDNNFNPEKAPGYKPLTPSYSREPLRPPLNDSRPPIKKINFGSDELTTRPNNSFPYTAQIDSFSSLLASSRPNCVPTTPLAPMVSGELYEGTCVTCRSSSSLCRYCEKVCVVCFPTNHVCSNGSQPFRAPSINYTGNLSLQLVGNNLQRNSDHRNTTFQGPNSLPNSRGVSLHKNRENCQDHPQYLIRFTNGNGSHQFCAVCCLKYVVPTPMKNYTVLTFGEIENQLYYCTVQELSDLTGSFVILLTRSLHARDNVLPYCDVKQHRLFKVIERSNIRDFMQPQADDLAALVVKINNMICQISQVQSYAELYQFRALLNDSASEFERLFEYVKDKGPKSIPSASSDPYRATGNCSRISGPPITGRVERGRDTVIFLELLNNKGKHRDTHLESVNIKITNLCDGSELRTNVVADEYLVGVIHVKFTIVREGDFKFEAYVNSEPVNNTPFKFSCIAPNSDIWYSGLYEPSYILGKRDDDLVGSFSKAWGVYISEDGYLIVADRGAHKINIYDTYFRFTHSIGGGSLLFDGKPLYRPSKAVTLQRYTDCNDVVICDKDNNRLLIVTWSGQFLYSSTSSGGPTNGLLFPWDICVTKDRRILCTDSRNDRIVIYDDKLTFLQGIKMEYQLNPRGICLGYLNHVIVTGFNSHEIIIFYLPSDNYKFIKTESNYQVYRRYNMKTSNISHDKKGGSEKNSDRMQGVCMDPYGNILACDSRQKRVRCVSYLGCPKFSWDIQGEPMGVHARKNCICAVNADRGTVELFLKDITAQAL